MPSKLALHFQQLPGWAGETNARWVKVMDPPSENRWQEKRVIGRCYMDDWRSNEMVAKGAAGAEEWFRFCQPFFARSPWVHAWEGPNEPQPVADLGFARALGAFTGRLADLMHGQGVKLVGGCLSEGNPGGDEDARRACFQAIAPGLAACDYWSQHCYWVPGTYDHPQAGMNDWHAYRYRLNLAYARDAGIQLPPLLITECGIDGGVVGWPKRGWKTFCADRASYMAQLAAFDHELARDAYVLAATVFTSGPAGWDDFEVDQELSRMIDMHITSAGGPYAPADTRSLDAMLSDEFGDAYENIVATLPHHPTLTYTQRPLTDIEYLVLHHTAGSRAISWQSVAAYHVTSKKWPGIAYHIAVRDYAGKCMVSLLNQPTTRSYHAHTAGNNHGLAVCVAGDFTKTAPTTAEKDVLWRIAKVVRSWATWRAEMAFIGHGDVPGNETTCPGNLDAFLPRLNARSALDAEILRIAEANQCISPNPNSAIEKEMRRLGYIPIGNEAPVFVDGDEWQGVAQLGYLPGNGREAAFFATNRMLSGAWTVRVVEP